MTQTALIVILITFLFIISMGVWNGFVIRWDWANGDDKKKLSKIWHAIGFVIRCLPLIPVIWYFWGLWWHELILVVLFYINFSWSVYDASIALVFGKPIWYTGSTSTMDKWGKIGWILKGLIFFLTVAYTIIYINY